MSESVPTYHEDDVTSYLSVLRELPCNTHRIGREKLLNKILSNMADRLLALEDIVMNQQQQLLYQQKTLQRCEEASWATLPFGPGAVPKPPTYSDVQIDEILSTSATLIKQAKQGTQLDLKDLNTLDHLDPARSVTDASYHDRPLFND